MSEIFGLPRCVPMNRSEPVVLVAGTSGFFG
jgi:hypothetical protein